MPNENQKQLVSDLLSLMNADDKIIYKQIIDLLMEFGYMPQKQNSGGALVLDFKNNKLKEKIAKIGVKDTAGKTGLSLKFYASSDYSQKFSDGVRDRCGWWLSDNGIKYVKIIQNKYIACLSCGKCNNYRKAYKYQYPDGKTVICCGGELIRVQNITIDDVDEIKRLIREQHEFFLNG